jgi:hypothetical protein
MASTTRDDMTKWGKIGHPMQSRGLSPKDRTPWLTLIITGLSCIGLGKAFLVLQANYETEGASWAAAGVKLDSGGAASGVVRRAGGGSAVDATLASDAGTGNALGSAAAEALRAAEPPPARGAAADGAAVAGSSPLDGLDASCGGELHLDLDGPAVSWGLDYKTVRAPPACHAMPYRALTDAPGAGDGGGVLRRVQEAHEEAGPAGRLQQLGVVSRAALVRAFWSIALRTSQS